MSNPIAKTTAPAARVKQWASGRPPNKSSNPKVTATTEESLPHWSLHGCRKKGGKGHCTQGGWSLGSLAHWFLDLIGKPEGKNDPVVYNGKAIEFPNLVLSRPTQAELDSPIEISVCNAIGDPHSRDLIQATRMMSRIFGQLASIGEPITLAKAVETMAHGLTEKGLVQTASGNNPEAIIAVADIPLLARTIMSQRNDDFRTHCNHEARMKELLDKFALGDANGEVLFETGVKTLGPLFIDANNRLLERGLGISKLDFIPTMLRAKNQQDLSDGRHNTNAARLSSSFDNPLGLSPKK